MFIEDLIQVSTGTPPVTSTGKFQFHFSYITGQDQIFLTSLANQIYNGDFLTEKQRTVALACLNKHKQALQPLIDDIDSYLDNPQWKYPVRVISKDKKILIEVYKDQYDKPISMMFIKFPYDDELVKLFQTRNLKVDAIHRSVWDGLLKLWQFPFTETNIRWLGSTLIPKDFQCDSQFLECYHSIKDIEENIEDYLPMLIKSKTGFSLKNCHKTIPQLPSLNLIETFFWARDHGITTWDNEIDRLLHEEANPVTKLILSSSKAWVNSSLYPITHFKDLINYGGTVLMIVPGGSELILMQEWIDFFQNIEIDFKNISVMFRLPNDKSNFNQFVKEKQINNPINKNTQIVFVSTKITKPLIKSNIKFNTVINLGYYSHMHFTMRTVIDNAQNLVYYNLKEPTTLH